MSGRGRGAGNGKGNKKVEHGLSYKADAPPEYTEPEPALGITTMNGAKKMATYIEKKVVDIVCAKMVSDGIPTPDLYFEAVGVPKQVFGHAMWRARYSSYPDARDIHLYAEVTKASAEVQLSMLRDWKAGKGKSDTLLPVLVKRYNPLYMQKLNAELGHMMALMVHTLDNPQTDDPVGEVIDALINYNPDLQLDDDKQTLYLPPPKKGK